MCRPFLFGLLLCATLSLHAQIDILVQTDTVRVPKTIVDVDGTPVGLGGWSRDTVSIKILIDGKEVDAKSKKGLKALKDAGIGESDEAELSNVDQLISRMIQAFRDLPSGDSLHAAIVRDQGLWIKARNIHCGNETEANSPAEQRQVIGCRLWATTCRLEDLLVMYDAVNK